MRIHGFGSPSARFVLASHVMNFSTRFLYDPKSAFDGGSGYWRPASDGLVSTWRRRRGF
jgi:hypothetical protein